jgi:WD40 repeat protein
VSGSDDDLVRIWDVETGVPQGDLGGHTDSVRSVAFSCDGRQLASGSDDRTVRVWNTETGTPQWILEGHTGSVSSVVLSRDGRRLASGSHDRMVRVWDVETGMPQGTLEGHTGSVMSVAFSCDGRQLASGSGDRTVRIWDAEMGSALGTIYTDTPLSRLSFSASWSGYCIRSNRFWITWNGKNILWLPSEYRPGCSIIREGTVAIGCASGRVLLITGNTSIHHCV